MAARALHDPELLRLSNLVFTIVVVMAVAGTWGVGRRFLQKSSDVAPVI